MMQVETFFLSRWRGRSEGGVWFSRIIDGRLEKGLNGLWLKNSIYFPIDVSFTNYSINKDSKISPPEPPTSRLQTNSIQFHKFASQNSNLKNFQISNQKSPQNPQTPKLIYMKIYLNTTNKMQQCYIIFHQ